MRAADKANEIRAKAVKAGRYLHGGPVVRYVASVSSRSGKVVIEERAIGGSTKRSTWMATRELGSGAWSKLQKIERWAMRAEGYDTPHTALVHLAKWTARRATSLAEEAEAASRTAEIATAKLVAAVEGLQIEELWDETDTVAN